MNSLNLSAINKAGYPVILVVVVISLVLSFFVHSFWFTILLLLLIAAVVYFFRDPVRIIPIDERLILSPADGLVSFIKHGVSPPHELGMQGSSMVQISIYLSVMNVHVNRMPVAGEVKNTVYSPGNFRNMYFARQGNEPDYERNAIAIEDKKGRGFAVVQIAGFIARRIVSHASLGASFDIGQRFGIICFGSRVDIYIPKTNDLVLRVYAGSTVTGGETILAEWNDSAVEYVTSNV